MGSFVTTFVADSTPLCPAGHLPLKGGDKQEACSPLRLQELRLARSCRDSISPLEGEMPGRAEGGLQPKPPGQDTWSTPR